jgi:hypothetical protein
MTQCRPSALVIAAALKGKTMKLQVKSNLLPIVIGIVVLVGDISGTRPCLADETGLK